MRKGIEYGLPTERERELIIYLANCIDEWIKKNETTRGELMCALTEMMAILIIEQVPESSTITSKIEEIEALCECLKLKVKNNS